MTRIFAISGFSHTGKTTLVESVIQELVERGYSVASAKSSKHDIEEEKGTDTWKHRKAGARLTVFLGPRGIRVDGPSGRSLQNVLFGLSFDFLIVEGMKTSQIPKIWCIGTQVPTEEKLPPRTVAVFAWEEMDAKEVAGVPVLYSKDMPEIIRIVLDNAREMHEVTGI